MIKTKRIAIAAILSLVFSGGCSATRHGAVGAHVAGLNNLTFQPIPDSLGTNTHDLLAMLKTPEAAKFFTTYTQDGIAKYGDDLGLRVKDFIGKPQASPGSLAFYASTRYSVNGGVEGFEPIFDIRLTAGKTNIVQITASGEFVKIRPEFEFEMHPVHKFPPQGYVQEFIYASSFNVSNLSAVVVSGGGNVGLSKLKIGGDAEIQLNRVLVSTFTNVIFASMNVNVAPFKPLSFSNILSIARLPSFHKLRLESSEESIRLDAADPSGVEILFSGEQIKLEPTCWKNLTPWLCAQFAYYDTEKKEICLNFLQYPQATVQGTGIKLRFLESACNPNQPRLNQILTEAEALESDGNFRKASSYYKDALVLRPFDSKITLNYVKALINSSQYEEAESLLITALQWKDMTLDFRAAILQYLATVYKHFGKREAAKQSLVQALEIISQCDIHPCLKRRAAIHGQIAINAAYFEGNLHEAMTNFDLALDLDLRIADDEGRLKDLLNKAKAYSFFKMTNEFDTAIEEVITDLKIKSFPEIFAGASWSLARKLEESDPNSARDHYEAALSILDTPHKAFKRTASRISGDYGRFLVMSKLDHNKGKQKLFKALAINAELKDVDAFGAQLSTLSSVYRIEGDVEKALLCGIISSPFLQASNPETKTFKDELVAYAKKHNLEYDEIKAKTVPQRLADIAALIEVSTQELKPLFDLRP